MTAKESTSAIERATAMAWSDWLAFLNSIDAENLDHTTIAREVHAKLDGVIDSAGWWAQSVTVAYEQAIGRRIPGQRSDGLFQCSVSRSTSLDMADLMDRWITFAATDPRVLAELASEPRVKGTERRINWRAKRHDAAAITVTSEPKAKAKEAASLIAAIECIPTNEANLETKERWASIVDTFVATLS